MPVVRFDRKMKESTLVWVVPSNDSFNRPENDRMTNALSFCQIDEELRLRRLVVQRSSLPILNVTPYFCRVSSKIVPSFASRPYGFG